MFYVYAIRSKTRNYIYVGLTDNVVRRLHQHNSGLNPTTKPYAPFDLIMVWRVQDKKRSAQERKISEIRNR